jgi:bud site selection protein 20
MGQQQAKKKGARCKQKRYKRAVWLSNRDKDIDQIQDELEQAAVSGVPVVQRLVPDGYDDELPGGGLFYCAETATHFIDATALANHKRTKFYKRRCKELKKEKYTQATAEWAAGKSKEVLPPAHAAATTTTTTTTEEAAMTDAIEH